MEPSTSCTHTHTTTLTTVWLSLHNDREFQNSSKDRMQGKWCLLAGADKHVVDDGEELHDSFVQVQVLQALEQVRVSAHTQQQDHRWAAAVVIRRNLVFYVQSTITVISGRLSTDSNQIGLKNKRNLKSFSECSFSFSGPSVWDFATCQSVKSPPPLSVWIQNPSQDSPV